MATSKWESWQGMWNIEHFLPLLPLKSLLLVYDVFVDYFAAEVVCDVIGVDVVGDNFAGKNDWAAC